MIQTYTKFHRLRSIYNPTIYLCLLVKVAVCVPQGEYLGQGWDGMIGIQVVDRGSNSLEAIYYPGGLPGVGWNEDGSAILRATADLNGSHLKFGFGLWTAEWLDGKLHLRHANRKMARLERVVRKSPTLGAIPPPGAVVLFRDAGVSALVDATLQQENFLSPNFASKSSFGAFRLHLEFRTGEAGWPVVGGIMLQERYELRLMNSFGALGLHRDCGGIPRIRAPLLNACFPGGTWQTLEVTFKPGEFDDSGKKISSPILSAQLNGIAIHENTLLPARTLGSPREEGNSPGRIRFYGTNGELTFRNIWVLPISNSRK